MLQPSYFSLTETVMGRRIESQTEYLDVLDVAEELMDVIYQRALKLWLQWDPLFYLMPLGKRFREGVTHLNDFNAMHIRTTIQMLADGSIRKLYLRCHRRNNVFF